MGMTAPPSNPRYQLVISWNPPRVQWVLHAPDGRTIRAVSAAIDEIRNLPWPAHPAATDREVAWDWGRVQGDEEAREHASRGLKETGLPEIDYVYRDR